MESFCQACGKIFKPGNRVEVLVRATYEYPLKSGVHALDTDYLEAVRGTIVHADCADDEDLHNKIGFSN